MSTLFSVQKGAGNSVVLIHGFCETHEIWNAVSDQLAVNYHVICLDLPGFGSSSALKMPFSLADIANNIMEWLIFKQIYKPVLIGHSLGGYVALEVARQHPTLLSGLGLFHSTAQADSLEKKENRNRVIDFISKNGAEQFLEQFVPSLFYKKDNSAIDQVRQICARTSKESIVNFSMAMRDRIDYQDFIKAFPFPMLFLCGEHDPFLRVELSKKQAETCQIPILHILEETGHLGMVEQPQESAEAINFFLNRCF